MTAGARFMYGCMEVLFVLQPLGFVRWHKRCEEHNGIAGCWRHRSRQTSHTIHCQPTTAISWRPVACNIRHPSNQAGRTVPHTAGASNAGASTHLYSVPPAKNTTYARYSSHTRPTSRPPGCTPYEHRRQGGRRAVGLARAQQSSAREAESSWSLGRHVVAGLSPAGLRATG